MRARYARNASDRSRLGFLAGVSPALPEIVAWPQDLAETQALIRQAAEMGLGVVPVGGLTNQFGAAHFERGGLCLDLKRMNRVLEIDAESLEVVCEAGVNGARLSATLARRGLTPGHIPASISHATIGGWIASRASGEASATEGRIEERLLGLTLVDGLGRVRQLDLDPMRREEAAALLVGSEGALGVICSARLRLPPRGLQRRFASFAFNGLEHGIDALRALLRSGLRLGVIVGLFAGPLGIIVGPFVGAVIGELIAGTNFSDSLRAGFGSFLGTFIGMVLGIIVAAILMFYYFKEVFSIFF